MSDIPMIIRSDSDLDAAAARLIRGENIVWDEALCREEANRLWLCLRQRLINRSAAYEDGKEAPDDRGAASY